MTYKRIDYERQILRWFLFKKKRLVKHKLEVDSSMFTSVPRKRVLRTIYDFFDTNSASVKGVVMGRKLLLSELEQRFKLAKRKKKKKKTEWELLELEVKEIFKYGPSGKGMEKFQILLRKLRDEMERARILDMALKAGSEADELDIVSARSTIRNYIFASDDITGDEGFPIIELGDLDGVEEELADRKKNPEQFAGIKTGYRFIDNYLGGLFRTELTTIYALSTNGKSTCARNLVCGILRKNKGVNVLHVSNEENRKEVRLKYYATFSSIPYMKFKIADVDKPRLRTLRKDYEKKVKGRVYIKEIAQYRTMLDVKQAYEELEEQGIKIDVLVVDWAEQMLPERSMGWGEYSDEILVYSDILNFIRAKDLVGIVLSQAATDARNVKKVEDANMQMVSGAKRKVALAQTCIFIKPLDEDKELGDGTSTFMVLKARDRGQTYYFKVRFEGQRIYEKKKTYSECSWR